MKLTVPASLILPANFSLLPGNKSLSRISIQFAKGYNVNINIQPEEIVAASKDYTAGINTVKNVMAGKGLSFYPAPCTGNTVNIAGITDYKNHSLTLLNAGGNILFFATLSKASVELSSLATVIYFVRVKNKVSGEAANLRYFKI